MREGTQVALEETLRELRKYHSVAASNSTNVGSTSSYKLFVSFSCFTAEELQVYRDLLPEVYRHVMTME